MRELSLYILDIAQNSLAAGACEIKISVVEDTNNDRLTIKIADNGRGMTQTQKRQAADPFYTTRTTRKVGLGIPLLRMAAEQTGGRVEIISKPGKGTTLTAEFVRSHIDCLPLGDVVSTLMVLIRTRPDVDIYYKRVLDSRSYVVDTRKFKEILGDVPLNNPDVSVWVESYLREHEIQLAGH
jgi:hypothetical protein